ncbi:MAG: PA0069 family radical SAM protein [Gammaproteobacteria bacterium]|jgi:DNA repair photolyase
MKDDGPRKGRGAISNPEGRFATWKSEAVDDGWAHEEDDRKIPTELLVDSAKTIIARNTSPDVPFDRSINPYKGCEHGCVYCYARPTHAYLDLSPGIDFETRIFYKPDAARLLEEELRHPGYECAPIAMGTNTDPYQPAEQKLQLTREILEVLLRFSHPVTIATKGAGLERDLDLLAELARRNLTTVMISVTTLDNELKRVLEPRTASPAKRLALIEKLRAANVPVGVLVAPVIPSINDSEIERILETVAAAGAMSARYILLRLPFEVAGLFREWLAAHYPMRAEHVMSLVQQSRGGRDYDARWGARMRGSGIFATTIAKRFRLAARRFGLDGDMPTLDTQSFEAPLREGDQLALF